MRTSFLATCSSSRAIAVEGFIVHMHTNSEHKNIQIGCIVFKIVIAKPFSNGCDYENSGNFPPDLFQNKKNIFFESEKMVAAGIFF